MRRWISGHRSLDRLILGLAWPNIISNLSVPLLGLVDLTMMGHLNSPVYIGAVALGSVIFSFIYSGLAFLRMGTTGMTAIRFGAGDKQGIISVLRTSIITALMLGFLLVVFRTLISGIGFGLLGGSEEVKNYARSYFDIRIFAAPAVLLQYVLQGWFIGLQDSRSPMYVVITENVLNILFNIFFVWFLNMRSDGIALGTVIARYAGLGLSLYFLKTKYPEYFFTLFMKFSGQQKISIKKFLGINLNLFIRTILLISVLSAFTSWSAKQGDEILASNSLLLQFFYLFSYITDGFAFAAESLSGRFNGGKQIIRLRVVVKRIFIFGFFLALFFSVFYFVSGKIIISLLTSQETVRRISYMYLPYIWMIPLASFAAFLWDGIYIGSTATRALRNVMIVSSIVFFILPIIMKPSNHVLWIAFVLFLSARGLGLWMASPKAIFYTIDKKS